MSMSETWQEIATRSFASSNPQLVGYRQRIVVAAEPGQHERAGGQAGQLDDSDTAGGRDCGVGRA